MLVRYEMDWECFFTHPRQSDRHPHINITNIRTNEFLVPLAEDIVEIVMLLCYMFVALNSPMMNSASKLRCGVL